MITTVSTPTNTFPDLPRHITNGEEVWGPLRSIQQQGEDVLAWIGQRLVLLPQDAVSEALLGQRIAVLRLDGEYYVRGLPCS